MRTEYLCTADDEGRKLYGILRRELGLSLTQVRRIKPAGGIFVNGTGAHTDYIVKPGDLVRIDLALSERVPTLQAQSGVIEVLWESEGLLIVNKPRGILVHPTHAQQTDTLANFALGHILSSGASRACHVVNRLDRDTSGAVLFAESARMKNLAIKALAGGDALKEYVALVCGVFEPPEGVIELPLRRAAPESTRRIAAPDGQRAVTEYATIDAKGGLSLVRFRLLTGRTHQIRAHCCEMGHPIIGDQLYFTEESKALSAALGLSAQALHAYHLRFYEPVSGAAPDVYAPIRCKDLSNIIGFENFSLDNWPAANV